MVEPIGPVLSVHFACNDHRNGDFNGVVSSIEFDGSDGSIVVVDGEQLGIRFAEGEVSIGGVRFETHGQRQPWVGNWCWDAIGMRLVEARRLLTSLLRLRWQVSEHTLAGPLDDIVKEFERPSRPAAEVSP